MCSELCRALTRKRTHTTLGHVVDGLLNDPYVGRTARETGRSATSAPVPAAFALGPVGLNLFGVVLWTAGMTSTIGASFTSASFLRILSPVVHRRFSLTISAFITVCTVAFLVIGQAPSALLVFAGAFNGLILPFGLALILWVAWRRRDLLGGMRQPVWMLVLGLAAFAFTVYAGIESVATIPSIFR